MGNSQRRLICVALVACIWLWPPAAAAQRDQEPPEVRRARQLFESEKETILFFAHPTATFRSASFDGYRALRDGYSITYTFNWTGLDDADGYSELIFECDSNGKLDFIRAGDSSAFFFKPFRASNTVVHLLKRELQKDPKLQQDRALMRLLDKDSKAILETYLRRDLGALMTLMRPLVGGGNSVPAPGGTAARAGASGAFSAPEYPIRTDKYVRERDGKVSPAPGYKWLTPTDGDLRTVWCPGQSHPDHPNVISGTTEGRWSPAPGYKWLTDQPGDLRVVKE